MSLGIRNPLQSKLLHNVPAPFGKATDISLASYNFEAGGEGNLPSITMIGDFGYRVATWGSRINFILVNGVQYNTSGQVYINTGDVVIVNADAPPVDGTCWPVNLTVAGTTNTVFDRSVCFDSSLPDG